MGPLAKAATRTRVAASTVPVNAALSGRPFPTEAAIPAAALVR